VTQQLTYRDLGHAGRLANSLWQVASTVGVARTLGYEPVFRADWPYRRWFSLPDSMFLEYVAETPDVLDTQPPTILPKPCRMYLQHLGLWAHAAHEVRYLLSWSLDAERIIADEWAALCGAAGSEDLCAVHVRRTDYATNPAGTLTCLPTAWHGQALAALNPLGPVVVFSDDPQWCRDRLDLGRPFIVREGYVSPYEWEDGYGVEPMDWLEIALMALCTTHVIANSSFSWWGAWLSGDPSPVYPGWWFGERYSYIPWRAMIPDGWREVPVETAKARRATQRRTRARSRR
jgi:hypothetical protein